MAEPVVRVIKANPFNYGNVLSAKKESDLLRVAAYARVSTESDEQEDSFERQVTYYTNFIQANPKWKFTKVYSDPGISGTRADKRPGFQEMIKDCKEGKIDRILVKSLARFARNTVDALKYIRELKEIGVSIFFEAQNIDTGTPGGDILITILAATAEEESRTISKNVRWSMQKKFEKGDFMLNYTNFLGYVKGSDGKLHVEESEAKIVRRIYREYLSGKSFSMIANDLMQDKVLTVTGKQKWTSNGIKSILTNEKYYGAALMGKSFKPDVLSPKRYKNTGQVDTFYAENVLEPIVSKETFNMVQMEIKSREKYGGKGNMAYGKFCSKYVFSKMIKCGTCGAFYTRCNNLRVKGQKVASWWCSNHRENPSSCPQKGISEQGIKDAFVSVLNEFITNYDEIKAILKESIKEVLEETSTINIDELEQTLNRCQEEMLELHKKKTNGSIGADKYASQGNKLASKIESIRKELDDIESQKSARDLMVKRMNEINETLDSLNPLEEFNEDIFKKLIEMIVVTDRYTLKFKFKCGLEKTIVIDK